MDRFDLSIGASETDIVSIAENNKTWCGETMDERYIEEGIGPIAE